uniref:Putative perlucin 3 n=1 Tax=Haliotis discus discus TaxID=91233 RepID=B6RAZ0_HALDI|nr:putative perlucin 3 [Haliotis discus discus]
MKTFCCTLLLLLGCALHRGAEGSRCRGGFHKHGGSCYWFSNIRGTFAEARSICRFLGSDLASITSAAEDVFIRGYATQRGKAKVYYLGGADLGLESSWIWTRNKPFTFTNWGSGQPGNSKNNEHCLALQSSDGYRWHDYNCDFIANFICKM